MRRPVGVKSILVWLGSTSFFFSRRVDHCRHASIRTLEERFVRSVHVGRSRFSRCCHLFGALWFCSFRVEPGPGHSRSHRNSALGFVFFSSWNDFDFVLPGCSYAAAATVVRLLLCNGSYTSPLTHK